MTEKTKASSGVEVPNDDGWTSDERGSLVKLIEVEPDLSEIVDDRRQRRKFFQWTQRITHGIVDFLKWAGMAVGVVAAIKTFGQGWLK